MTHACSVWTKALLGSHHTKLVHLQNPSPEKILTKRPKFLNSWSGKNMGKTQAYIAVVMVISYRQQGHSIFIRYLHEIFWSQQE
jgi:hypothetical protein